MPPARREKARVDPAEVFNPSQSSNDLDYDLKTIMLEQYCAKICKKRIKEEKSILREGSTNATTELTEIGSELVEALKVVQVAWETATTEHGKAYDRIARDMAALENHELEMQRCVTEVRKAAASTKYREEQNQRLEKIRGICEVAEQLCSKVAGDLS